MNGYELIKTGVIPCYKYPASYENKEEYWIDLQNCLYHTFEDEDEALEERNCISEYWIICPFKPYGVKIDENNQDKIKWLVYLSSTHPEDEGKEWDFDKHCTVEG